MTAPAAWPDDPDPSAAPVPLLASVQDMQESPYRYVLTGANAEFVERMMQRASRAIESRCDRRFMPFTGITQTNIAEGVPPDGFGGADGFPLTVLGQVSLARSGALWDGGQLVRDVWLDETAPRYQELWTYSDVSVQVTAPSGAAEGVGGATAPTPDTGHIRFPVGTYCPLGSLIQVTYSGGYTRGYPHDLTLAAMMEAAKLLILQVAPERRQTLNTEDLELSIKELLAPYARF